MNKIIDLPGNYKLPYNYAGVNIVIHNFTDRTIEITAVDEYKIKLTINNASGLVLSKESISEYSKIIDLRNRDKRISLVIEFYESHDVSLRSDCDIDYDLMIVNIDFGLPKYDSMLVNVRNYKSYLHDVYSIQDKTNTVKSLFDNKR